MNKTLQITLNIMAVLAAIIFFTLLFFPLEAAISHGLSRIETETKGKGDWRVSVSKINASLIFDTKFEDFRVFQNDVEVFFAPVLKVDTSLFSLVSGKIDVAFEAIYSQGELSGRVALGGTSRVDLTFDEFALKELSYLNRALSGTGYNAQLTGIADGSVSFNWDNNTEQAGRRAAANLNEGVINLKIASAEIESLQITALNVTLPKMVLSSGQEPLEIAVEINRNQILINRLNVPGPDLSLTFNGSLNLDRSQSISRFSLDGRFALADEIKTQIPLMAMLDKQMTPEGFYPLSIRGSAKKPEIQIGDFELSSFLQTMTTLPPSEEEGIIEDQEATSE
jgi:type II secretion system protein N